jgi:adenine-specific DNA-methyltransferase
MPLSVSYMGTKKALAPDVAEVVAGCRSGPMLDLFAGMCSVATAVAKDRQVWCNDIQSFAALSAAAFFTSRWTIPDKDIITGLVAPRYARNQKVLAGKLKPHLQRESDAFESRQANLVRRAELNMPHVQTSAALESERRVRLRGQRTLPYCLFSITYAGSYFGLKQCGEIDSIRFALDDLLHTGDISFEQHRWLLLALCQAISKVATTTGHFAQPMTIKPSTTDRYLAQRRRSVFAEWLDAQDDCTPVGTSAWRRANRVFQSDAVSLLNTLWLLKSGPAVVYADPPYTADQYSRFYHVYETLLKYDYPESTGTGRYRGGRFVSDFSCGSTVVTALDKLASACARLGSSLVLSYPANGLIERSTQKVPTILRRHFRRVEIAVRKRHRHSSMGAASGTQGHAVTEIIYLAE